MRAFVLRKVGATPELADVDEPVAGDGQAVVTVQAAGLNPVDLKQAADPAGVVPRVVGNEAVVVLGASGAVDQVAVQAARLLGAARVVAVGRDRSALARALDLGADEVVTTADGEQALLEATRGGADVVLDPVFGPQVVAAPSATRLGARVVSIGSSAHPEATVPFAALRGRSMLTYSNQLAGAAVKRTAYERMLAHLQAGEQRVEAEAVGLEQAPQAWERQATAPRTKLVVVP